MANLNKADTGKLQRAIEGRNSSQGYVLATKQEFKALQERLAQHTSELKEAKAGSEKQSGERVRLETELRDGAEYSPELVRRC